MKTVVIWDQCGTEQIKFFVADGDLTRFNLLYINTYTEKTSSGRKMEKLLNELNKLVYDQAGNTLVKFLDDFPADEVKTGAKVIVAGFLP